MKPGLWRLTSALNQIDKAINYFMEYANSGSKFFWDRYVINHFSLNLALILEEQSIEDLQKLEEIFLLHERVYEWNDYSNPPIKKNVESVLNILFLIKKDVLKIWMKEVSKITRQKLQNEEYIKEIIQYNPDMDSKEIIPKFLNLASEYLKT